MKWDWSTVGFTPGYRRFKYLPFSKIADLIDQVNYVGFHDVCNYPGELELTFYKNPNDTRTKGIDAVFVGYTKWNNTGKK